MKSLADFLEKPVTTSIVLLLVSSLLAILLFVTTGGVAEVTSGTILGVGFRAGGSIAAAVVLFLLTSRYVTEQRRQAQTVTPAQYALRVVGAQGFDPMKADTYVCEYQLLDVGWSDWKQTDHRRYGQSLLITVRDIQPGQYIKVRVRDGQQTWKSIEDAAYGLNVIDVQFASVQP